MEGRQKIGMDSSGKFRFGVFEVDLVQRELRNRGIRVHLQKKPFQILELLLRRSGALVTRDELVRYLWPDSHVSFGHGLNTAINTLRHALGDTSNAGRFIETRSGLGYRFVAHVEEVGEGKRRPAGSNARSEQDYRTGKFLQSKMTEAALGQSIVHFEAALAQDPTDARAYAALAETYTLFALSGMLSAVDARRRAVEFARKALEIDPGLAEGYVSLANIQTLFDGDHQRAEQGYARAFELDSKCRDGRRWYASFLSAMGRHTQAAEEIHRAQEADPVSLAVRIEAARSQYMARRFQGCVDQAWQTLMLEPQFAPAQLLLGMAYQQLERYEEAITELQNARICSGESSAALGALGNAFASIGERDEAQTILQKLDEVGRQRYVSPYCRGLVYIGLGELDPAFSWLERGCDEREVSLVWLNVEPRLDPLRSDPRFHGLRRRMGLNGEHVDSIERRRDAEDRGPAPALL